MGDGKADSIPLPTIRRYPEYLLVLETWLKKEEEWISATDIGHELDRKPIVVRKDLAYSNAEGYSRKRYKVNALITSLKKALGWDKPGRCLPHGTWLPRAGTDAV